VGEDLVIIVIPAKAGIQARTKGFARMRVASAPVWIPAFAGMTKAPGMLSE
jgi:hypothetical protein